jgi:NDP-sugar pyrophosphorylase family protein
MAAALPAVVMAAGEGRRLRPLTERYAKPALPIDGRPVVATLLRELAAAGVRDVALVTGHLAGQVEAVAGDGSAFGLRVRTVSQPQPDGSADAVRRAVEAGVDPPFLVTAADTVFSAGDVGQFATAAAGADGAIAVRRYPPPDSAHRRAVRVVDGRVERVRDDDPRSALSGAPLWLLGPRLVPFLCVDERPYELRNTFQRGIDEGADVRAVEIGATRDLTHPVDLVNENFAYLAAFRSESP